MFLQRLILIFERPGLGQAEARSVELYLGLLCGWQGPKHLGSFFVALPNALAGSWVDSRAAGAPTGIQRRCGYFGQ